MTTQDRAAEVKRTVALPPHRRRCALCGHGAFLFVLTRDGRSICTACYLEAGNPA